jgi:hypothetical protein
MFGLIGLGFTVYYLIGPNGEVGEWIIRCEPHGLRILSYYPEPNAFRFKQLLYLPIGEDPASDNMRPVIMSGKIFTAWRGVPLVYFVELDRF